MLRRLVLLSFALLLGACSSNNVQQDFDASRDFAAYRSWAWQEPACSTARTTRGSRATSPNSASARPPTSSTSVACAPCRAAPRLM
jgi:hypothetical protein